MIYAELKREGRAALQQAMRHGQREQTVSLLQSSRSIKPRL